ncbi:hypothetical protein XocBAI21_19835 [Xanthomonas oryzae pv. oryzicola]|nr:hypothetical protein XocBAI21_19835 [Xanthomonas oryzae pv. oryzicola]
MGENCQKPGRSVTKTGNSSTPENAVKPCNGCGLGVFQGRLRKGQIFLTPLSGLSLFSTCKVSSTVIIAGNALSPASGRPERGAEGGRSACQRFIRFALLSLL